VGITKQFWYSQTWKVAEMHQKQITSSFSPRATFFVKDFRKYYSAVNEHFARMNI
jgi:hypothetical protein